MSKLKKKKVRKAIKHRAKELDNYRVAKAWRNLFVKASIVDNSKGHEVEAYIRGKLIPSYVGFSIFLCISLSEFSRDL
ncbi:DUF3983 domain-containing protein [Bacillus manliponensis]|uniref:DUF3983 domain-containing protein n=1 Tax=Bacillus manliponensis TaxID=574376 RepID=UPI000553ED86